VYVIYINIKINIQNKIKGGARTPPRHIIRHSYQAPTNGVEGDSIGVGYAGVEMVRGRNRVRREGGLVWAKKTKTEPWRLGFG